MGTTRRRDRKDDAAVGSGELAGDPPNAGGIVELLLAPVETFALVAAGDGGVAVARRAVVGCSEMSRSAMARSRAALARDAVGSEEVGGTGVKSSGDGVMGKCSFQAPSDSRTKLCVTYDESECALGVYPSRPVPPGQPAKPRTCPHVLVTRARSYRAVTRVTGPDPALTSPATSFHASPANR